MSALKSEAGGPRVSTNTLVALDAVAIAPTELSPLQRLKLTRDLLEVRLALSKSPPLMERLKLARRLLELRVALGQAVPNQVAANDIEPRPEVSAERTSTAQFFDFDDDRKPAQRKRDNAAAMALIKAVDAGEIGELTDDQKAVLAKYSGTGGNLVGADGKKGSAYEYYTPKPIAEGAWALLRDMGFEGGNVLDPCSATGVFGATAPVNAAVDAVELNETSGRVNQLVNDGPGYKTTIAPFEQVAAATPDETYDAVISNVPFGEVSDRGGNQFKDTRYRDEPIQNYFILRGLEKLRPGGLAAFITPPRCMSGKGGKEESLRQRTSYLAEFMGAYRLPNKVFGTAAADTMTDLIVFRKFKRPVLDKIAELREQNPQALIDAKVIWQKFIGGTYFAGEGLRFVLGTPARAKGRFGERDVLNSELSVAEIAKLLHRFPESRIDWAALDAAETVPTIYRDGDTIAHAGQTLQMVGGRWRVLQSSADDDSAARLSETIAKLSTPLGAVNAGILYREAQQAHQAMVDSAQALDVPDWLRGLLAQLQRVQAGARESAWMTSIVGLAIDQARDERQAEESGFNYLEGYPALSEAMMRVAADAKKPLAGLPASVKSAIRNIGVHYSHAGGYSAVWRGDVAVAADTRTEAQKFEAERYQSGGGAFIPLASAKAVYGADFDSLAGDDWCVSADGQSVAKADDYYVGNYADFLERINADIAGATDDMVRSKLLRQKQAAESRLLRGDPSAMHFTLFTPFVTMEERAEFLRRFVDPRFAVAFDEKTGAPIITIEFVGGPKTEREKLLRRFALYLSGNRLTLGGIDVRNEQEAIKSLRAIASTAAAQFNSWAKANPIIMGRLSDLANDPRRIYFRQVDDDSPLDIPGLNPAWKTHGYQAAWVRKMGREFGGINGDDVGLGKTSQGLIAAQHAHAIGTKQKTMIVVPNSVLSNWRKEAARVYSSTDDCLYVGLKADKAGELKTDPSSYDADLNRILENRHRKVFVTFEAFFRLRLRDSTAEAYDAYLAEVDATYASSDSKKEDEKTKSLRAQVIEQLTSNPGKSVAAPFFEDLGVDSLLIDEGHMLKNSRGTVDFKGGKFLSLAEPSGRGLDAQAKAWWVRRSSKRNDGVILLTATPITNSPLEIYSMLSLAIGDAKLNNLMMGVRGADDFMEVMCQLENRDEETLDGQVKPYDVFVGLNNVDVLRVALQSAVTARTAEQVGEQIVMPGGDSTPTKVTLPAETTERLVEYKQAFRFAIDTLSGKADRGGSEEAYDRVVERFGEPMALIGHPFNLISKMALLIADPELDERASFYTFSPAQADKVADLVKAWNAKAPTEDRPRAGPHTSGEAIVGKKTRKDGDEKIELLRVKALAKVDGSRVVLDTMQADVQAAFDAMADKAGIDFDVSVPPKLAALIANFQFEEANPRGRVNGLPSGRVRQLIFCDALPLHSKIKRLLVKRCGVSSSSIAIITGKVNGKPEEILEVQDGFNAEGESNKYRVVIMNEKGEVGINLQKGTQAIHHLTLGWTPDSLTQRDGRGRRQGNETDLVRSYHYDGDGTFDCYKRTLVGKKSDWIESVMDPDGDNNVTVAGGLTREQLEALIDSVGDSDAMGRIQARAEAAERLQRATSTQGKQAVNLATVKAQRQFLAKYPTAKAWAADKLAALVAIKAQISNVEDRLANPKATASALVKNQNLLAELQARRDALARLINESVTITGKPYTNNYGRVTPGQPMDLDTFIRKSTAYVKRGETVASTVAAAFRDGHVADIKVSDADGIGNEWRSEVDLANSMIEASRKDFAALSGQEGGYSTAVLARADAGEAAIIDGKVICVGAFVERAGFLGVVRTSTSGMVVQYLSEDGKIKQVAVADELRKATPVLPGSAGYDEMITRAAKIEDAIGEVGDFPSSSAVFLFSTVVPEVAQRRTKPLLISYSAARYFLPAPYFSVVLPNDVPEGARVVAMIVKQQAAVVVSTSGAGGRSLTFQCDSTVAVEEDHAHATDRLWKEVVAFALANKVKITPTDFEVLNVGLYSKPQYALMNGKRADFNEAVIAGATSEADLMDRARAWLQNEAFPAYDLSLVPEYTANALLYLRSIDYNSGHALGVAIEAIRRAEQAAKAPESGGENPPAPEPAAVPAEDPNRLVGITGNTREWKDHIKSIAQREGGRAIWDGRGGPIVNGEPAGCWNVTFKAWLALVEAFPRAGQELHIVKSTGKTEYGRR
jgi:hypothetical protein